MDSQILQALIESVATEVGCSTRAVSLSFQDYGPEDGGYGWTCATAVQGKSRAKDYRPAFTGYADSPEGAVKDLLGSDGFRRWKDPEGFGADRAEARRREALAEMLSDGDITQEAHDRLVGAKP